MAAQKCESLLDKPRKPLSKTKTLWLIVSIATVISASVLIATYVRKPNSMSACEKAVDKAACSRHVSEVTEGRAKEEKVLERFLRSCASRIEKAKETSKVMKYRMNSRKEEAGLKDCEELMEMARERVWDSVVALTKKSSESMQDAHTWLSSVLTNHVTCLDGLEGAGRAVMEEQVEELISRARTSLAMLVAVLPSGIDVVDQPLDGVPSWVTPTDRRLLLAESGALEIQANVVVAKDGSGKFKTVAAAVASAPDNAKTRYVIYVKKGTYKENVEIGKKKKNVMLVGDGMDATLITGSLNVGDGSATTFTSATVAVNGDGFIAQDIWFQNTAGPEKHQAVALRVSADLAVINRCRVDAYQDTLYTHTNRQFYRDSFVTGTVDFIFGDAAVVFQKCKLVARKPMKNQNNMVTAQGREDPNQNTGTSIQKCDITPSSDLKPVVGSIKTYLGRPWKKYSRTVVMQSFVDSHIDPAGWAEWSPKNKDYLETLYYGEYMNNGPGAGTGKRVTWPGYRVIKSAAEAAKFTVKQLIQGDIWLKNTGVTYIEGL